MRQFLLLIGLLFLIGCSSGHDDTDNAPTGSYVGQNDDILVSMELTGGNCRRITAFNDRIVFCQYEKIATSGQYPDLSFSGDDFIISCKFANGSVFSANASGKLPNNVLGGKGYTDISGTYNFKKYDGVLDANGDGILDQ